MKNIVVTINRRNLSGFVNKASFKYSGMFVPYHFIAMDFHTESSNTAVFYDNVQPSHSSWLNYPGQKIWDNSNRDWTKKEVLRAIESEINQLIAALSSAYPETEFKLIGF